MPKRVNKPRGSGHVFFMMSGSIDGMRLPDVKVDTEIRAGETVMQAIARSVQEQGEDETPPRLSRQAKRVKSRERK